MRARAIRQLSNGVIVWRAIHKPPVPQVRSQTREMARRRRRLLAGQVPTQELLHEDALGAIRQAQAIERPSLYLIDPGD